jgi:hypothetical protein
MFAVENPAVENTVVENTVVENTVVARLARAEAALEQQIHTAAAMVAPVTQ